MTKIYTKEECEAFNNQKYIEKIMEVSQEIKEIKRCIDNMELNVLPNYIPWKTFMWIFGGTMGFVLIAGGWLFSDLNGAKTELGVYKSEMAKELSEIKQATIKTSTDVAWIKNTLSNAEIYED